MYRHSVLFPRKLQQFWLFLGRNLLGRYCPISSTLIRAGVAVQEPLVYIRDFDIFNWVRILSVSGPRRYQRPFRRQARDEPPYQRVFARWAQPLPPKHLRCQPDPRHPLGWTTPSPMIYSICHRKVAAGRHPPVAVVRQKAGRRPPISSSRFPTTSLQVDMAGSSGHHCQP